MLGSTIETGAADIRGRFAAAETPRMSICGYWRMAAVISVSGRSSVEPNDGNR